MDQRYIPNAHTIVIEGDSETDVSALRIFASTDLDGVRFVFSCRDTASAEPLAAISNVNLVGRVCEHLRLGELLMWLQSEIPARLAATVAALDSPLLDYAAASAALAAIESTARTARQELHRGNGIEADEQERISVPAAQVK